MNVKNFARLVKGVRKEFEEYSNIPLRVVVAQAVLETGKFSSREFLQDNNAFGLKKPSQRPTTALTKVTGIHADYANVSDSIRDYFLRQRYFRKFYVTDNQYVEDTLKAPYAYAEDPNYKLKWLKLIKEVKEECDEVEKEKIVYSEDPVTKTIQIIGVLIALFVGFFLF